MLKRIFWIILLAALIFLGHKRTIAFFCETELTREQVLYETASDTLPIPPDSLLQEPVILSITAHILRKENGYGGISETTVLNEIERINQAFAPSGISFEICTFNYINSNKYYNLTKYDEARLTTYDIENTINIYFVNEIQSLSEGKICGYTYYPTKNLDHVFLTNSCVPQGTTLIHELGHFFGLYHTHEVQFGVELVSGANCKKAGDLICDTAADPGLRASMVSSACEFTGFITDIFKTAYEPPVYNFMSYSRQSCRKTFSENQLFKMRLNYHYFKTHIKKLNTRFEVSDSIIVEGDTLTLEAAGGKEYWWSTGDTTAQIKIMPDSSATYSVNIVTENGCNVFKNYAVEVISGDFIAAPEFICEGQSAPLILNNTKPQLIYMLSDPEGKIIYSSLGNGDTLMVNTPPLIQDQQYLVAILNPETEQYWQIKEPLSIQVIPKFSSSDIQPLLPSEDICKESAATIKIPSSDPGLSYQLIAEDEIIATKKGNQDTLTLVTAPVDSIVTYHLRIFNECNNIFKRDMITFVPVLPPPPNTLEFTLSSRETVKGSPVSITVQNSDSTLSYQLMLNNTFVGETVSGNGEDLLFRTPPLMDTAHFCLVVFSNEGCRTITEHPITINVKEPGPEVTYTPYPANLLTYALSERKPVRLLLYHLDGREAAAIVRAFQEEGEHRFLLRSSTLNIPPGPYMLRLQVEGDLLLKQIVHVY